MAGFKDGKSEDSFLEEPKPESSSNWATSDQRVGRFVYQEVQSRDGERVQIQCNPQTESANRFGQRQAEIYCAKYSKYSGDTDRP